MTDVIILAAGKGLRLESNTTKVLNSINGKPMISYLLGSVINSKIFKKIIIVVSIQNQRKVKNILSKYRCHFIVQKKQIGTANAVESVLKSAIKLDDNIMVLLGDHPLISFKTIKKIAEIHYKNNAKISMITAKVPNYDGIYKNFYYDGRIKRNEKSEIIGIIEPSNATNNEMKIREINPSLYIFNTKWLKDNIGKIKINAKKKEYYLTDIMQIAYNQNYKIFSVTVNAIECFGVNTQEQLKQIQNVMKKL